MKLISYPKVVRKPRRINFSQTDPKCCPNCKSSNVRTDWAKSGNVKRLLICGECKTQKTLYARKH